MRINRKKIRNSTPLTVGLIDFIKRVLVLGGSVRLIPDTGYTDLYLRYPSGTEEMIRIHAGYHAVARSLGLDPQAITP